MWWWCGVWCCVMAVCSSGVVVCGNVWWKCVAVLCSGGVWWW